jgi:hypothetical protein
LFPLLSLPYSGPHHLHLDYPNSFQSGLPAQHYHQKEGIFVVVGWLVGLGFFFF